MEGRQYRSDMFAAVLYCHVRLPLAPHIAEHDARAAWRSRSSDGRWKVHCSHSGQCYGEPTASQLAFPQQTAPFATCRPTRLQNSRDARQADPRGIRDHYRTWGGRMVAKLAGGQIVAHSTETQFLIPTTLVTQHDPQDEAALCACPAIYQRLVEKLHDLRVTVVGDEVFARRIVFQAHKSARVDWCAADEAMLDLQPCRLDTAVAGRCRALLWVLGFKITGMIFVVTSEGDTVFLEINAVGRWAWVQEATGLPVAELIARRLSGACGGAFVPTCPS